MEDAGALGGEWRITFDPTDGTCEYVGSDVYAMYPDDVDFGPYEVSGLLEGSCGSEYDGAPKSSLAKQYAEGGELWSVVFSDIHASPGLIVARVEADAWLGSGPCTANITAEKISPPPL